MKRKWEPWMMNDVYEGRPHETLDFVHRQLSSNFEPVYRECDADYPANRQLMNRQMSRFERDMRDETYYKSFENFYNFHELTEEPAMLTHYSKNRMEIGHIHNDDFLPYRTYSKWPEEYLPPDTLKEFQHQKCLLYAEKVFKNKLPIEPVDLIRQYIG